ncbi:copper homeostasis protein CutC [Photobacterium aphoticum]|uniref:PF03932 family protein CutC n=2 Tax=Photobacterium aphoticum TaxID=754436 RepID=A0A0J1GHV2_9GAMM|nr:copper homeostasis protein CutC [Photobacterium aphoticum]KLU99267.1 copper homeostasis protein CutC [Photobacterium aphoticum]PSU56369.1 copper homeostasis protein CutC [Photobacterium aphoticum]GHA46434.1 copper homeostasis protein CutC [Photobacterium aphoticum]
MLKNLEVCIDNIESLHYAQQGGATRIELCSSLALGGLTPNVGLMKLAARHSRIPVYAMIRPRQGDFFFSDDDKEIMLADIHAAKQAGLAGVVVGVLNADSSIDNDLLREQCQATSGMGITFHRAIDQCLDPMTALDIIMQHGCERVLTSGLQANAEAGIPMLKTMVDYCGPRLSIMAGAGVTAQNVARIVQETGVTEVHLSGKSTRASHMTGFSRTAYMGSADVDDFAIPVTDPAKIAAVLEALR